MSDFNEQQAFLGAHQEWGHSTVTESDGDVSCNCGQEFHSEPEGLEAGS